MTTFIALYRGQTVGEAKVIGLSAEPNLVSYVATKLLDESGAEQNDPVLDALGSGREQALRLIARGETEDS